MHSPHGGLCSPAFPHSHSHPGRRRCLPPPPAPCSCIYSPSALEAAAHDMVVCRGSLLGAFATCFEHTLHPEACRAAGCAMNKTNAMPVCLPEVGPGRGFGGGGIAYLPPQMLQLERQLGRLWPGGVPLSSSANGRAAPLCAQPVPAAVPTCLACLQPRSRLRPARPPCLTPLPAGLPPPLTGCCRSLLVAEPSW